MHILIVMDNFACYNYRVSKLVLVALHYSLTLIFGNESWQ